MLRNALSALLAAAVLVAAPMAHAAEPAQPAKKAAEGRAERIDLNSAPAETLAQLKGIGPVRAEAIIKGRPYKGKDELVRRKILPQSVYDQIRDDVVARQK